MKSLLFIGHKFHEKTRSSDFLIDILRKEYEVTVRSLNPCAKKSFETLDLPSNKHFNVLIFWQIKPKINFIKNNISYDKGVFFPMFDDSRDAKKIEYWYPYRHFHIINFCHSLHSSLKKAGFSSHYIQYFPKPYSDQKSGKPDDAFFWNRTENINCDTLNQLHIRNVIRRLHIHKALDPNHAFIQPNNNLVDTITYSDWYPKKSDMLEEILNCAIYIAPRKKEGIGLSFLEAMAMGRCVIAPDAPTMNEYINHGVTGILYSLQNPQPIEPFDLLKIQDNTLQYMRNGYTAWKKNKSSIIEWIEKPIMTHNLRMRSRVVFRILIRPIKFLRIYLRLTR